MADQPAEIPVNTAVDPQAARAALRRDKIAARLALAPEVHARASAAILERLAAVLLPRPPGTLAFCWPIRNEVDCRPLAVRLSAAGWQLAMPVVVAAAAPMRFFGWTADTPMTPDPYGIPIPADTTECTPDVVLLPLVAFDAAGYRLGYGGGYFDRTLAACAPRPFSIGVGFELGRAPSIVPGTHDVRLDCIITETVTCFPHAP